MSFRKEEIYGKQKDNKTHGGNLCRDPARCRLRAACLRKAVRMRMRRGGNFCIPRISKI